MLKRMLALGVAMAIGAAAGVSAEPEGCPEKAAAKLKGSLEKADRVIAKLKTAPDAASKLSEADRAALAGAQAVLAKSCPICKVMPGTMGFLGESLAACASLDKKACEEEACEGGAKAPAAAARAPIDAKACELFGAMCAAMKASAGKDDCETACEKAGKDACEKEAAGCPVARLDALIGRADAVSARWREAAGTFGALTPEERAPLASAMETMGKSNPACAAWPEAITALQGLLKVAAARDRACEAACAGQGEGKDEGCGPYRKRAELTRKVLGIVTQVAAVTAPGGDACCEKEKAAVTQ